jgi:hypothetical protein
MVTTLSAVTPGSTGPVDVVASGVISLLSAAPDIESQISFVVSMAGHCFVVVVVVRLIPLLMYGGKCV